MNKKLFGKLNWVDLIIIVAVLAAAVIVGYKMFLKPTAAENTDTSTKMAPVLAVCSMAGISKLHTEAAVITPAAKPKTTF